MTIIMNGSEYHYVGVRTIMHIKSLNFWQSHIFLYEVTACGGTVWRFDGRASTSISCEREREGGRGKE